MQNESTTSPSPAQAFQAWLSSGHWPIGTLTLEAAFCAGRVSVLGDLSESVSERGCPGSGVGGDCATVIEGRSDTLPCPVCPGTTEHEGELCDDCAAYVGAAPEVGR